MKAHKYIRKSIADSFTIWANELKAVFADVGVIIFFFVVPLAYPVIYGLIYNPETVHDVPMIVVDESRTAFSREFVRKIDATPDVHIYDYANDMEEARRMLNEKKAYGILHIPSDFSYNINRGEQSTVSLYANMSALLHYKALLLSTTEASMDMRSAINVNTVDAPVQFEAISMYNPKNGFASFLVPGIVVLVIQQTLLLGICMLAATNRERNPRGMLIPADTAYHGTFRIVFGKALAYLSIYVFVTIWALVIVPSLFKLPLPAHYGTLLLFSLPYLLACIFFSMSISSLVRGRETPMMIFVFTSVPLLFLSGISWPVSAIPDFWRYFSYAFPSTFGIQGFVKLNSMGAGLREINFEYRMLWILTGVYFIITYLVYNRQKRDKSEEQRTKSGCEATIG